MEESGSVFPGFQTISAHKEEYEYVFRRPLSKLQSRAPCPLQLIIKPIASSLECKGASNSSSAAPPSSSFTSVPIPLLAPLVLPSLLDSSIIQEGNTAKSH
ncbi:hypothetical protein ACOSQ3_018054 [Xanthoceras sorbifolium]